ncbi:hypothetical protein M409DRAFT_21284 [Zasmidium cellare ATCC 36951]|uniref:Carboxylic ester hydrolase n=1 Tax=Zasmidium cellare ATCC 36951 TaxID=1080233 RepID=A0A6A6CN12_ZASCE|nr:uncharacterized protein M409DRAFT_21284 [Zasmidium cellare ATCC 36951]KAF2168534.1 hypothetical protein M409DRAFT_21284 [Zasmidium cellare ATCC 36951]
MYGFVLLILVLTAVQAARLDNRQAGPSVTISNDTIVGSSSLGIDSFKGISFAQPPVGNLRLRPPQPIVQNFGTIQATGSPKACPQFFTQANTGLLPQDVLSTVLYSPLVQEITNAGEDCLTLNVQRPSNTNPSSKLPVLFWIFGGGFEVGSTSTYDGGSIIRKSLSVDEPVIYVSTNYRVGGFGFLAGNELAEEHSTNLGLRDQRLALQWVAENIAAFGGDPDKVTIFGESAGSISVFDHTVINGGDNTYKGKPLFRGAIMSSGCQLPALDVRTPRAQEVFDTVVKEAGCSTTSDKLSCLRSVDYITFLNAANSVPGLFSYQSFVLSYFPRPDAGDAFYSESPDISIASGRFTKVPVIIGDQEDEGTLFALFSPNLTTNNDLASYLVYYFPENPNAEQNVRALLATYPDAPLLGQPAGSPFRTGVLNNLYPQFKRLAAVRGDFTFNLLARRAYLHAVSPSIKAWSYISSYLYGTPVAGTFHGSDLIFTFGLLGDADVNPITDAIQTYLVSFVNHLDPNVVGAKTKWPLWRENGSVPLLMDFLVAGKSQLIPDDFRQDSYEYLLGHQAEFRV